MTGQENSAKTKKLQNRIFSEEFEKQKVKELIGAAIRQKIIPKFNIFYFSYKTIMPNSTLIKRIIIFVELIM